MSEAEPCADRPVASADDRELITRFLQGREVRCPACDYVLTDLPEGVCPECGLKLELRIGLAKPKLAAYVAGIVGLSAGMGFHAVLLCVFFISVFSYGPSIREGLPMFVSLPLEATLLVIWIRGWAGFQRRSSSANAWLGIGSWVLSIISVLWLIIWVG